MSAHTIIALILIAMGSIALYIGFSISLRHLSYFADFIMGILVMPVGFVFLLVGSTMASMMYKKWTKKKIGLN